MVLMKWFYFLKVLLIVPYGIYFYNVSLCMYIVLNILSEVTGGLCDNGCRITSLNRFFKASDLVIITILAVLQLN